MPEPLGLQPQSNSKRGSLESVDRVESNQAERTQYEPDPAADVEPPAHRRPRFAPEAGSANAGLRGLEADDHRGEQLRDARTAGGAEVVHAAVVERQCEGEEGHHLRAQG